jgi:ribosomal protein S18 acetylase RimI-like enzyme
VPLADVTPELRERTLALAPHPRQERWSGRAKATLPAAERHPDRRPVVALDDDGEPVGFFVLDVGPGMPAVHAPGTVGVRGLFVDARHQRRGHGVALLRALPGFVRERYPGAQRIALTVNVDNPDAVRTYRRAGFRDTGRRYRGGSLGPQHILELDL